MKTYQAKPSDIVRQWYVIDASTEPLGRLSTKIATLLTGKGKPQFTKHIDCGDYVIVINAANLKLRANKVKDKKYYSHSHHPGGLTTVTFSEQMAKDPTVIIRHAVRGMLPVNKLRTERLNRLKIYQGSDHTHEAQQPIGVK